MLITLLSDFGLQDISQSVAKGILLKSLPDANFIDLSHNIAPYHLLQCSYFLKGIYNSFPEGTIHLSLFDMLSRRPSQVLLTSIDQRFIISADNGLLPMAFKENLGTVYKIADNCNNFQDWLDQTAVFINRWAKAGYSFSNLTETKAFEYPYPFEPYISENAISCQVIHIDRFGNIVLNLNRAFFEAQRKGRPFRISFSRNNEITTLSKHYSDVPEGEKLCLFNLGDFMEIAVNKGSAAQLFGFILTREEQLIYQKIKIEFL